MKAKYFALASALLLPLCLVGCGGSSSESPANQVQNLKPLTTADIQFINDEDKRVEAEEGISVVN